MNRSELIVTRAADIDLHSGLLVKGAPMWAHIVRCAVEHLHVEGGAAAQRLFLPYRLHPMNGTADRIVLNRRYRPVGRAGSWASNESLTAGHFAAARFRELRAARVVDSDGALFDDFTCPWYSSRDALRTYSRKLDTLLAPWLLPDRKPT